MAIRVRILLTLASILALPSLAEGQVWLADRQASEGPGIKLGDSLVLHPGLGIEGGYDTNPLYLWPESNPQGSPRLRFSPYIDLATPSAQRQADGTGTAPSAAPVIAFRLGAAGYYDWYLSDAEAISAQSDFGIAADLGLTLFPEGAFSLLVDAQYMRMLQPGEFLGNELHARQQIQPGFGIRLRPGGGALTIETGYRLRYTFFELDRSAEENNSFTHEARLETRWRIFPKTALISRAVFSPIQYRDGALNQGSMPIRAWSGLQGLVTDRFGISLLGGYGASFYEAGPNYDSWLASGELMFFVTPTANIRLGGDRDFVDTNFANFFVKNGGYLSYQQMFGGMFLLTLRGEVYRRGYSEFTGVLAGGESVPAGTAPRVDWWINGSLMLELRLTDWLSLQATGQYIADLTEFEIQEASGGSRPTDFQKFEVFGGVRVHY